ncbi:MAG: hypothetical protein GY756_17810 [bacterium]|nr:hypothetical protein [bacterium]
MNIEELIKLIKENCYKETIETEREDEIRYFMCDEDVKELAEEIVKKLTI